MSEKPICNLHGCECDELAEHETLAADFNECCERYSQAKRDLAAMTAERDEWRTRCQDAQRALGEVLAHCRGLIAYDDSGITISDWDRWTAARDAGKN